ncbi:lachesin-like isoform X2 [Chelonus insularis]|uniref:lachesin-like isoform X2 n=1 Tax=Chelonus insularis TaxID=460826 RepID=UPI00158D3DF4|nr:lachesin-like isoform X2 [Chelonus insularis]
MMLIFLILVAVFLPSTFCLDARNNYYISYTRVEEGESLEIECRIDGYTDKDPPLPIKWYREPRPENLTLSNGETTCECGKVIKFPSITRDQRGDYVCSVDTESGSVSRFLSVDVHFVPFIKETYRINRFEKKEIELRCYVESYPSPNVIWMKDNTTLFVNEQYQIEHDSDYPDLYDSTLTISTKFDYYGNYTCQFINTIGHSTMTFNATAPALTRNLTSYYGSDNEL